MGGMGTYYLGSKYNDIWAGLAPISGLGGIADAAAAERYKAIPMLMIHGEKARLFQRPSPGAPRCFCRRSAHEFWVRRGAQHMEKPFLFFSMLSKRTTGGFSVPPGVAF